MKSKNKIEILKRKRKGKTKRESYDRLFKVFSERKRVDLEDSDQIIERLKELVKDSFPRQYEIVNSECSFIESDMLRETYQELNNESMSYIFTDDFIFCGMYLVASKEAIENAFSIAKKDQGQTCFILDNKFQFSFTINFYDLEHNDHPDNFEIQRHLFESHMNNSF